VDTEATGASDISPLECTAWGSEELFVVGVLFEQFFPTSAKHYTKKSQNPQ
jgi:hypothetical protein